MSIQSIPKGLSGVEALDSMLEKVRERLVRHDRFAPHKSYQGYEARIRVEFYPAASFAPPLTDDFTVGQHESDAIVSQTALVDETVEIPLRPPNQVRVEAGMNTPVMVPDGKGGTEEKWISKGTVPGGERKKGSKLNVSGGGVSTIPKPDLKNFQPHSPASIAEVDEL